MKLFGKEDRSTFPYFWPHWCAVQMTALILGLWTPRFLFHDINFQIILYVLFYPFHKLYR